MPTAPAQGDDFVNKDLLYLVKVKRRILYDLKRNATDRERLDTLLSEFISLYASCKRYYISPEVREAIAHGDERMFKRKSRKEANGVSSKK